MKTKAFLLLVVSCVTLQVDADENSGRPQQLQVFPKQSELVYGWRADVSTGAKVPETDENHASHFAITANLRVRSDATSQRVEFKLEDVQYSSYNGKVTTEKLPVSDTKFLKKSETLGKPFIAYYDGTHPGHIASVELSNEDEVYARNIKRAIMAQFQLDFQNIPLKRAFKNEENGVKGSCPVEQYLKDISGNGTILTLRKFYDSVRCYKRTAFADTLAFKIFRDQTNEVTSTAMRNYVIVSNSLNTLMIKEVESKSEFNMQPHGLESDLQFHFTNQKLHIISDGEASTDDWEIGKTLNGSLDFELPNDHIEFGTHPDLTFGAIKHDSNNAVDKTMSTMRKLAAKVHSKGTEKAQTEELHELSMMRQLNLHTLKRMSSESLQQLIKKVLLTRDGTLRALLLEILPRIGTLAATRTIVALCSNNTDFTAREKNRILMAMPFYLRHYTEQLVKDCEPLLTSSDSDTAILAFSSIVGEVCEKPRACSTNLVEGYVKRFITKLEASKEYGEKLLYLQALNNIQVYPVSKHLETIIRDRANYDHKLRYAAAWSSHHIQIHDSHKTYEIFWPILADCKESPEMRQSALTILLLSSSSSISFFKLFWYVTSVRNQGLNTIFYTTVQSLLDTKEPSLKFESRYAKLVTRSMSKRNISSYAPTNIIRDFFDPDTGMGYKYQELSIEDRSSRPTLKYFDLKQYLNGQVSKDISLYTRGINIDFSFFLGHFNKVWYRKGSLNEEYPVSSIFKSLGVTPREELQDPFEFIFRVRDRTVLCLHYKRIGDTEVMEIFQMLGFLDLMMKFTSAEKPFTEPFNSMNFDMTSAIEIVRINDVGLPVTLFTHQPDMMALVGNISMTAEGNITLVKSNLALRFIGQRAHGIYTLNPVAKQWQGVVRSKVGDMFLPLGHELEIDTSKPSTRDVTLKWEKDQYIFNAMNHVHTATFAIGDENSLIELNLSCPKCSKLHAVKSGLPQEINQLKYDMFDSEFEFTADLYDCDVSQERKSREIYWNALTSSRNKNIRSNPWFIRLFMEYLQLNNLNERLPYSGSCGQSVRIAQKGEARQLSLEASFKKLFNGEAVFRRENGEPIKTWTLEIDATHNTSEIEQITSTVDIHRKLHANPNYNMVCFKFDAESPKQIDENDVWDVLYEPPWRPYVVRLGVTIGDSEDGNCPTKSGGKLLLTASSTPRKPQNAKDGNLCERDEHQVSPATVECANAIHDALNSRNISIDIQHNNLPTGVQATAAEIATNLESLLPYINPGYVSNPLSVENESNLNENSVLWLNGVRIQRPTPNWDVPNLFKLIDYFGSIHKEKRSCVAAGGYVLTFDESSIKFTAGTQWTLLSAHCGPVPTFAVFVRHVEGSDTPDIRVYVDTDVFHVSRENNETFAVFLNGDPFDPLSSDFCSGRGRVDLKDDVVRIYNRRAALWVKVSNKAVTITTSSPLMGLTCGLCGDYNHQSEIEYGFPGPDGQPVALDDLARVYSTDIDMNVTLPESPCNLF